MILTTRSALDFGITFTLEYLPRGGSSSLGAADNDNPFVERKLKTWLSAYNEFAVITGLGTTAEDVSGGADVSEFPLVARGEDFAGGSVVVRLNNGRATRKITLNMGDTGGSLGGWVSTAITANTRYTEAIATLTPLIGSAGHDLQIYRDKTTLAPKNIGSGTSRNNIERNPDWWGDAAWDLSGIPIWNSGSNSPKYGMALITPDHLLAAHHYKPNLGATVEFLGADGTVYTRSIIGQNARLSTDVPLLDDLHVFTLGTAPSGFATNVSPFELIGSWVGAFGVDGFYPALAGIYINQARKGYFTIGISPGASTASRSGTYNGEPITFSITNVGVGGIYEVNGASYLENEYRGSGGLPGDSGGAYFHAAPSGLVLAGLFENPSGGPFPHATLLNAMIASADASAGISTGLTVTVAADPTL